MARAPGRLVAELTARRAVTSGAAYGLVFGLFVAVSAIVYASTYTTLSARAQVATTFGTSSGLNAILGSAHGIDTVAGYTAWRSVGVLSILGAVWGLLTATRLLRGEEDAGRWELLLVGQTTRRRATAQALFGLLLGLVVLWGVTATITLFVGLTPRVGFGVGSVLFLAFALVSSAAIFLAVGALTSQLAPTRRQAAGYAAGVLGIFFAVRMVADSGSGPGWLRWLSPLGWVEELRPLTGARPLVLLPICVLVGVLAGCAIWLSGARDLGTGVVADRASGPARTRLLSGTTGLAIRLSRGVVTAWCVAIALGTLMMGLFAQSAGATLAADAADRDIFTKLGFEGTGAEQYLAITFLLVAAVVALIAAGQISSARTEEVDGRVDHLVVRPVSRYGWLAGRLVVAVGAVTLAGVLAGLACWVGAASQHTDVGFAALLGAGLNVVPPALLVLGLGALVLGLWPRAVAAVTYGLVVWSFLVEILGGIGSLPALLLDTSLFHQMAAAPAASPDWVSSGILVALGVLAAAAGAVAFRHRDLTSH